MWGYLLMGTRATDGGGRKNHGKPASPPTELGANKTSYASAKIGGHDQATLHRDILELDGMVHLRPGFNQGKDHGLWSPRDNDRQAPVHRGAYRPRAISPASSS